MQQTRLTNLHRIQGWIKEAKKRGTIDRELLIKKCVLVLGCTRRKAVEYLNDVGFEG